MKDFEEDQDREELAHIPWSMLADELDGGRSRTMVALVLAVIAAVVVGVVGFRVLRRTPGTVVDLAAEPPVTAAPAPSAPAPATAPPSGTAGEVEDPVGPALYAEADLMAVAPEQEQRGAAAGAEWFVVDSFTVDDVAPGDPALWVEWARAAEVVPTGPGTYEVMVVFSTLGRDGNGAYARAGLRAVRVPMRITPEGVAVPADYPEPVALAATPPFTPPPDGEAAVPDAVAAAAVEATAGFGSGAEVIAGSPTADGWRVVLSVVDPSGIELPLVVHVDG